MDTAETTEVITSSYYYDIMNLHELHKNRVKVDIEYTEEHEDNYVHYLKLNGSENINKQNIDALNIFEVIKRNYSGHHYLILSKIPYYVESDDEVNDE